VAKLFLERDALGIDLGSMFGDREPVSFTAFDATDAVGVFGPAVHSRGLYPLCEDPIGSLLLCGSCLDQGETGRVPVDEALGSFALNA
jgi:hypothetical protein